MRLRVRRTLVVAAVALVSLVVVGYVSVGLSAAECERQAARWAMHPLEEQGAVTWFYFSGDPHTATVFDRLGISLVRCPPDPRAIPCLPRVRVDQAVARAPFLATVKWAYTRHELDGAAAVTRFICLFGFAVEFGDERNWIS